MTTKNAFRDLRIRILDGQVHVARGPDGEEVQGGRFSRASDREIIERALRLANMQDWRDFAVIWGALGLRDGATSYSTDSPNDLVLTFTDERFGKEWRELFSSDFEMYKHEQKHLVKALRLIQEDLPGARKKLAKGLTAQLDGVVVVTIPEFRDGRLMLDPWPFLPTVAAVRTYATALLLDERRAEGDLRTFGDRLRQCALGHDEGGVPTCGNWFLAYAGEGGGPLRKYCSTEHRLAAAAATAGERQRRSRAGATKERRRPK